MPQLHGHRQQSGHPERGHPARHEQEPSPRWQRLRQRSSEEREAGDDRDRQFRRVREASSPALIVAGRIVRQEVVAFLGAVVRKAGRQVGRSRRTAARTAGRSR